MNLNTIKFLYLCAFLMAGCQSDYKKNREYILPKGIYNIYTFQNQMVMKTIQHSENINYVLVQKKMIKNNAFLWNVEPVTEKNFKLKSIYSNKYLTVVEDTTVPKNLLLTTLKDTHDENQIWIIHKFNDNKFKIINKKNRFCLFVSDLKKDSSFIEMKKCDNKLNEFWIFENVQ